MKTAVSPPLVRPDAIERLVVHDRLDHVAERLSHDVGDLRLVPALGEREHRLAQLLELLGRRTPHLVDELTPRRPEHQPAAQHPGAVQRTAEGDHRRLGDHRLVEVEERGDATRILRIGGGVGHPPRVAGRSRGPDRPLARVSSVTYRRHDDRGSASPRTASPDAPHRGRAAGAPIGGTDARRVLVVEGRRGHHRRRRHARPAPRTASARRRRSSPTWPATPPRPSGSPIPRAPGIAGWLAAGPDVPPDALHRLEVRAADGLELLPRGDGPMLPDRAEVLARLLAADGRDVVVDCGTDPSGVALVVAASATRSVLVTRACFLSLRRATSLPLRPSEVVLLTEPGRALGRGDVERTVGAPIVAEVAVDPQVARAVDAGLLTSRLPRGLARDLARAA